MKTLDVKSQSDAQVKVSDIKLVGNTDVWQLVCKASSESQGWMKSTKAMELGWGSGWWRLVRIAFRWLLPCSGGVLVQVSTQQGDHVAEALCFCPGAVLRQEGGEWVIR